MDPVTLATLASRYAARMCASASATLFAGVCRSGRRAYDDSERLKRASGCALRRGKKGMNPPWHDRGTSLNCPYGRACSVLRLKHTFLLTHEPVSALSRVNVICRSCFPVMSCLLKGSDNLPGGREALGTCMARWANTPMLLEHCSWEHGRSGVMSHQRVNSGTLAAALE